MCSAATLHSLLLGQSADFTFGVQGQHADLMNFMSDLITTPENEDMLTVMQGIRGVA